MGFDMSNSRAEFEKWYSSIDGYGDAHKKDLWESWKASRAALCVNVGRAYQQGGMMADYLVEAALEEAGVSYV